MRKRSQEREPIPLRWLSQRLSSDRWARSAATILVRADREKNTSTVTANWLEPGAVRRAGRYKEWLEEYGCQFKPSAAGRSVARERRQSRRRRGRNTEGRAQGPASHDARGGHARIRRVHAEPLLRRPGAGGQGAPGFRRVSPGAARQHRQRQRRHRENRDRRGQGKLRGSRP